MIEQSVEKVLPIFRSDGSFDERAHFLLLGYMLNPSDVLAVDQFADLLLSENTSGRDGPSAVTEAVVKKFARSKNRGDVAGFTVLMMAHLEAEGEKVSLGRAQAVTEEFLVDVDANLKAGLPLNRRDIRKHFDVYKDVAHLWAAKIIYPEKWLGLTESLYDLLDFLSHAKVFEGVMRRTLSLQTPWAPWRAPSWLPAPTEPVTMPRLKDAYLEVARTYSRQWGA